jgi:hypothetical protein
MTKSKIKTIFSIASPQPKRNSVLSGSLVAKPITSRPLANPNPFGRANNIVRIGVYGLAALDKQVITLVFKYSAETERHYALSLFLAFPLRKS